MPTSERLNPTFPAAYPALLDKIDLARQRLIVALDVPSAAASAELVKKLEGTCQWFKVGLELFTAAGPDLLETFDRARPLCLPRLEIPRHPQHRGRSSPLGRNSWVCA